MTSALELKYIPFGIKDPSKRIITNPAFKDAVEFRKFAMETNGEYCDAHVTCGPAGGNPLHWHTSYTETFEGVQGTLGVELDGKIHHLANGQKALVPIGHVHRFFNPSSSDTITFNCTIRPTTPSAGIGFEQLMHISYGLATDGLCDKEGLPSPYYLLMLMNMGDTNLTGVGMYLMGKLAKLVRWHAQWSGEEDRLLRKYYGTPVTDEDRKKFKLQ